MKDLLLESNFDVKILLLRSIEILQLCVSRLLYVHDIVSAGKVSNSMRRKLKRSIGEWVYGMGS